MMILRGWFEYFSAWSFVVIGLRQWDFHRRLKKMERGR